MNQISRKLKGLFMLFRVLPVMVWSLTGSVLGTAFAVLNDAPLNWVSFFLVFATAALIQGYPTHIINDIQDWKSGADGQNLREKKSGGSKVLQAQLLSFRDLWLIFVFSHILLAMLIFATYRFINLNIILWFMMPGYLAGILYSLPPFRFSYRPFLGEWLGGFAGMALLVLGSYYAQQGSITLLAVLLSAGIGLIYIGVMIFFHYLDFDNDRLANPVKNTTVVYLGLKNCRRYAVVCVSVACATFLLIGLRGRFEVGLLLLLSTVVLISHLRTDLDDALSIISWGKFITYSILSLTLLFGAFANIQLLGVAIPILLGFWSHKQFGKLKGLNLQSTQ